MEYAVRKAALSDLDGIERIEREAFTDPWSRAMLEEDLIKENGVFLIAVADGVVCGYADGEDICGDFYVNNLAVAQAFRKRQIGEKLLRLLIEAAQKRRCSFITLEVRAGNLPAQRLYEKCGFKMVGERPNYYSSPTENAYIFTLNFPMEET